MMKTRSMVLAGLLVSSLWLVVSCGGSRRPGDAKGVLMVPSASAAVDYQVPAGAGPDELARLAVRHHPSIVAARQRALRLAAQVPQQRALPDPMAEISPTGAMAETAAGSVGMMGGVSQTFPFPGKRREDAAAAEREAAAATAEIRAMELQLSEQVRSAWWDHYLASRTLGFTEESRSLLEAVRDALDARVAAGQAGQGDQLRLSNELAGIDRDLAEARQLGASARARLNSLLNRPAGARLPAAGSARVPSLGSLQSLLARAQARHPEVAAAEERANAYRHRLKRAELERFPDLTAGVMGASVSSSGLSPVANGKDQLYATFGVNIPLWQEPRKAMLREARAGIAETEALVAATRADLRYRVEEAWIRAKTAGEVASLFETRLIPEARQGYELSLTGYATGTSGFTELVESWRQLLSYQLQLAGTRAQLGKADATLRAAAGVE